MTYYDPNLGQGAAVSASEPASLSQNQSNNANDTVNPANANAASEGQKSSARIAFWKGTWFDPSLDFRDPEGDTLTRQVLSLIDEIEPRERKLRQADAKNRYAIVRAILANGFRCFHHRRPIRVTFHGRINGYKNYAGRPSWLTQGAMPTAVRLLAAARLIKHYPGERGRASTYHIMPRLYGIAQGCGITRHSLTYPLPSERLVRLRKGKSGSPYLAFEPTDDSRGWTTQLKEFNAFVRRQDIALALGEDEQAEWVAHWNEERRERMGKDRPDLFRPELFQTDLYRQFNNGSFEQGGRLYGAWWINAPGRLRQRITINSKPTIELDYSACHLRMLYHERGIDYEGDPYRLEELTDCEGENGLPVDYFREGMKSFSQALINGKPGGKAHMARLKDSFSFLPYFQRPQLRQMFEEKHQPIVDAFETGAGLRLQRQDSDIALSIITRLRQEGIVALPIHDSFIVPREEEDMLFWLMGEAYRSIFNHYPIIKYSN